MAEKSNPGSKKMPALRQFGLAFLIVAVLLGFFFRNAFKPGFTVFSNDGPLGAISCQAADTWASWTGSWLDLNWLGAPGIAALPNISNGWGLLAGKLIFSKTYALVALLFVSMSAWVCFRQFKFTPVACILGAIAVALNTDFVATAGWGVAAQPIAIGFEFLALGALADLNSPHRWARVVLGGFATGMGVMEAFDIGAIFSLFIAAFVICQAFVSEPGLYIRREGLIDLVSSCGILVLALIFAALINGLLPIFKLAVVLAAGNLVLSALVVWLAAKGNGLANRAIQARLRGGLVAICAVLIASAALYTLISTQIKGVAGMAQDKSTREDRWVEATLWSAPKSELVQFVVAGVFGYRMDTPEGGGYWGQGGRHPAWDEYLKGDQKGPVPPPGFFLRYGGGGAYIGVPVALIILWALGQSFRRQDSVFSTTQRKLIWFWFGSMVFSVLMALGRHAPFYRIFYELIPYVSTIRNPTKYGHVIEWALLIIFGYGVHGLSRRYMDPAVAAVRDLPSQFKNWWSKGGFDKKWFIGSLLLLATCVLGWLIYASMQPPLEAYLVEMRRLEYLQQRVTFNPDDAAAAARATAAFSIRQVGYFLLYLAGGIGLLGLILSGCFSGKRARWGRILLGALLIVDLGRVAPYSIIFEDYKERLIDVGNNQVIDFLKQKPYEHRVAYLRIPWTVPQLSFFEPRYRDDWLHHVFPYNNIQSLDEVMNPRMPAEEMAYKVAMSLDPNNVEGSAWRIARDWELTNTRYLVGPLPLYELLNTKIDAQKRFRPLVAFELSQSPGGRMLTHVVQKPEPSRPYFALYEFTGALPRAKLYSNWQISTNDETTLKTLASQEFDPEKTILVAEPISPPTGTNASSGTVEFVSYLPKRIVLRAKAEASAVLLLNDKHDQNWKVTVDGKPAPLLRCNYIMRGVQVSPGEHTVEFRYTAPYETLYVSLVAIVIGFALLGYLGVVRRREMQNDEVPATPLKPAKKQQSLNR